MPTQSVLINTAKMENKLRAYKPVTFSVYIKILYQTEYFVLSLHPPTTHRMPRVSLSDSVSRSLSLSFYACRSICKQSETHYYEN